MTTPEVRLERDADWLVVHISGMCNAEYVLGFIEDVAAAARAEYVRAVLIDGHDLVVPVDDFDRHAFGTALSRVWNTVPLAVIGREPFVDPQRLGEAVARKRGVNIRVFTDEHAARQWLLKVAPPRP